jgi:mono/diheme cytochrome c family protein
METSMIVSFLRCGTWVAIFGLWLASPTAAESPPAAANSNQAGNLVISSTELGEYEFRTYCAVCHGTDAKGTGIIASVLSTKPSDLTILREKSGGIFPREQVSKVIDGRVEVKAHGSRVMPIWGDWFSRQVAYEKLVSGGVEELAVQARIDALVTYIEIQQLK